MRHDNTFRAALGLVLLLCLASTSRVPAQDNTAAQLDELMARMPTETAAARDEIVAGMLKLGEAGVRDLCGRIRNQNEPLDGKVCAALHALVHAAGRAGAERDRAVVAGVFSEVLQSEATIAAKSALITELRTVGRDESVGPVGALLSVDALCEPAAQTLVSIGSPAAAAALRQALPGLQERGRVTVAFALGRIRDTAAVPLLLQEAGNADPAVRHAALYALAEIGDPAAAGVLRNALAANDAGECEAASHRVLRFALRLGENGHKTEAIGMCRELLSPTGPGDPSVAPGAFYEVVKLLDTNDALDELLAGLGHKNPKVRTVAVRAASDLPGEDVTRRLARALVTLSSDQRAPVVELLRQRGDPAALGFVVQALNDPDRSVRIAAMAAVGQLGKRDAAAQLIAFLGKTSEEADAARSALTIMGDKRLNETLVASLPEAVPSVRRALLTVLAERDAPGHRDVFLASARDAEEGVRHVALKILGSLDDETVVSELMRLLAETENSTERKVVERALLDACRHLSTAAHAKVAEELIDAYREADVAVTCALINAVTCMAEGYPQGLAHVSAAWRTGPPPVRSAALRALAEWPTPTPMADLLKIAADTNDMTEHVLALRGCIRMAGQVAAGTRGDEQNKAIEVLRSALAASRRLEEKRQVLGAVSAIASPEALQLVASSLDDAELSAEATAAAVKIGLAMCQPAKVLVAFDSRATELPDWLKTWTDTRTQVATSDTTFRLYATVAPQEAISLGGNRAPGASSQYLVILTEPDRDSATVAPALTKALAAVKNDATRKQLEALIAQAAGAGGPSGAGDGFYVAHVSTGAGCKIVKQGLREGAKVYIDRAYVFGKIPAELQGATYVMMANDDKTSTDREYIVLTRGEEPEAAPPVVPPTVKVVLGGELVTEYHYADADRPYFYPVIAPTGDTITRNWPMSDVNPDDEQDHKHHRSLWFTHGDVNGHDFWSEGKGARIVQTKLDVQTQDDSCLIVAENEWRAADGQIVCTDVRRHTIRKSGDQRIIDFRITLKASHGKVVLGDTKEGSMAVRVAPTLRTTGKVAAGSMVNSEGGSGPGIWGKRANWCDYYGPINGKTVGIAIMDHPDNPRHPTWWHARDYGLCAANPFGLSYFEGKPKGAGAMTIEAGDSVTFRYRVLVHNGTAATAGIETLYRQYAAGPESLSIFNGKDFAGWRVPGNNIWWTVDDGMISAKSGPEQKGSILWTEKTYRDFVVELDFRYGEGTVDSGIFIRTESQQVQLGISGSLNRDMTGSVYVPGKGYPQEAEGVKDLLKLRDWNTMKVQAVDNVYTIWLNGQQVLVYNAEKAIPAGPIGLQLHPGKTMAIDFRHIQVTELE